MNELKQFLAQYGLSQASIARSIGVSGSAISQYMRGKYTGDVEALEKKISTYIENYHEQSGNQDNIEVMQTADLVMIDSTLSEIVINQEMGVIYGKAGTGKTAATKKWVQKHPEAILIETDPSLSTKELLLEILKGLGQKNMQGSNRTLLLEIVKIFKKSERVLLIDEAENLTTKSLEAIRRIHDFSHVPVALIGTYALIQNMKGRNGELLQLYSRVNNKWEMRGLNDDDRQNLFGDFGSHIKRYANDARRSFNIYKKAQRLSQLANEELNGQHILMAAQTVILD